MLKFDERGDREAEYSVKHYQSDRWEEIASIESVEGQPYKYHHELIWQGEDELPTDTPSCGFDGKKCSGAYDGKHINKHTNKHISKHINKHEQTHEQMHEQTH